MEYSTGFFEFCDSVVITLIVAPMLLVVQIVLVIGWKVLNLLFRQRGNVFVFFVVTRRNPVGRNQEQFAFKPAARIDDNVAYATIAMIKNYVMNFPQLLVIASV